MKLSEVFKTLDIGMLKNAVSVNPEKFEFKKIIQTMDHPLKIDINLLGNFYFQSPELEKPAYQWYKNLNLPQISINY